MANFFFSLYTQLIYPEATSAHCLLSFPCTSLRQHLRFPPQPPHQNWKAVIRRPPGLLSSLVQTQLLQPFLIRQVLQPLISLLAHCWTLSVFSVSLLNRAARGPELDTIFQVRLNKHSVGRSLPS